MIIMKFGGTSLGSPQRVENAMKIVAASKQQVRAVVCSAFGKATDLLILMSDKAAARDDSYRDVLAELHQRHITAVNELVEPGFQGQARDAVEKMLTDLKDVMEGVYLVREASVRTMDYVMGFGERLSCTIFAFAMRRHLDAVSYLDARRIIRTDAQFGNARVDREKTNGLIGAWFEEHPELQIVTGFIAATEHNAGTTLGRGGSDYTASLLGAALAVTEIQIWTDVDGVLTSDPRKVADARCVPSITYEEAMEMSHFGASVIYPPTMAPAMSAGIPLRIKNTFHPEKPGTAVKRESEPWPFAARGVTAINDVALVQLKGFGLIGAEGASMRMFGALAKAHVNVILISQASSEYSICVAIAPQQAEAARTAIEEEFSYEILMNRIERVRLERDLSVVALVGRDMRNRPGISGLIFGALGRNLINVVAIAQGSSERNISFLVRRKDLQKTLNAVHHAIFDETAAPLHLFLIGPGLIGSELLAQIQTHGDALLANQGVKLEINAVANSKRMIYDETGLDPNQINDQLSTGETLDARILMERMRATPRAVLVDCTSSEEVSRLYQPALESGIPVVTPNKKANSGPYEQYRALQTAARSKSTPFLYEANVGAGLPILSGLRALISSGDRLVRIEAMLSGTMSYLFNAFDGKVPFSQVVAEAKQKGFTEPDPRDDLSGTDVARKLLILARESGFVLELEDLEVENLVPEDCQQGGVSEFLAKLAESDSTFAKRLEAAQSNGSALRYIAVFENGKGSVSLRAVGPDHPCFTVAGCDNIACFTTERYNETPLVIKGPGAGAAVTAAQVLAELVQVAKAP